MDKLGILGPPGTHSEAAALYLENLLHSGRETVVYDEIFEALRAVETGDVTAALVPVENSLEGSINITLDVLASVDDLCVTRELIWPVHNFLVGKGEKRQIKKIYSHPQPISQCRQYILNNYPAAEIVTVSSTAKAAQAAAAADAADGVAAICTARAGALNNLNIFARHIEDNSANSTRFLEIARRSEQTAPVHSDKMLIICNIDGKKAGTLCDVLQEFARRGINLTRIESRPARTQLGEYIFFFDLETDMPPHIRRAAVTAVRQKSIWLKELGEFPVITAQDT